MSHFAAFIANIWQVHPFREGNTRTVGLFAIKYLRSRGYDVTNALFAEKSWYFRNALVRANYENDRRGVEKTLLPLEEFFKVLLFDADIKLQNSFLHIDYNYGTPVAESISQLHRKNPTSNPTSNPASNACSKQVRRLLSILEGEQTRAALMKALKLKDRVTFQKNYLGPCLKIGLVEMTQPDSPRSPTQRYRLTESGLRAKARLHSRNPQ